MTLPAPDPHDLILLRFLMEDADVAPALWDEWATTRELDDHTAAAFELLPAAHLRLVELDIDHPWRARLKGTYRRAWVEQKQAEAAANAAVSSLVDVPFLHSFASDLRLHGGDAMVGRGAAPRLTVANTDAHRAYAALLDAGWNPSSPPRLRSRVVTRLRRFHRGDHSVEIGTTPLAGITMPVYNAAIWSRSVPAEQGANRSLRDTVLSVLLHDQDNEKSVWWAFAALTMSRRAAGPLELSDCLPPSTELCGVMEARLLMLEQLVGTMSLDLSCPTASSGCQGESDGTARAASLRDVAERWIGLKKVLTFSRLELKHHRGAQ